ncbi:DNA polymerase III subunit alpha [uncultured Thiodictyon sp.]|uniref:DNA polymerase III subunit alpha n=1 Tax=uncultured Thiodictyon sp. TaxID=1846217 RepID=UPI0025CE2838|nr:DNA polymerase III subunit alpha [uncultured Thiodictyon sp.]
MDPRFIHLHLHTEYSLVDGLVGVKPLVKAARKAGMPAVAITDQCNFFALVRFYKAALNAGIKPIAGADLWVKNPADPNKPHRLVLLVQDKQGYGNLTRLISRAYVEGQYLGVPQVERDWIAAAPEGLIALSGGPQGDVASALLAGNRMGAEYLLDQWLAVFGDRYYLELIRTGREQEAELVEQSVALALVKGVPVVATNDVRFIKRDDFEAHEVRVCIHEGRTLDDPRRPRIFSEEQYLRTPEEMVELFADCPEALENSVEIAKRCNLELELGKNYLPDFPVPAGMTMDEFFRAESEAGLNHRFERGLLRAVADQEDRRRLYAERLDLELGVICQMGFPGYFLIVADFIAWAKRNGIPVGPGRGSGAGSLVAYALGITDLDPIQHDLLFERFLNPERVSMPDFDVDFCMEGRDRVIDYVADRYGREAVSQIITFGSMAAKAVVRDVGRVMGHPYGFVDRVAKMVPFELGMTLEKALTDSEDLKAAYEDDEEVHALIDMGRKLEGCTRNAGKHAGGVVIAPTRLTDFAPLYCEPGGVNLVTQFDKDDVESVGLVKFDFLGLRTLTIIDWALKTINARLPAGAEPIDIEQIDPADPESFALLKRCETTAVFQLESRGMKELIKKLQPDSFGDITALVALFRPGPLQSGMVDDFINRKHGRADVAYPHPDLEPVLAPTYGIILYQEQVMQIAQVLAGYSLGGADLLRRAMGKKKAEEMAQQRAIFQEGAEGRGVDRGIAAHIFDLMEKFAGYGFNKSHSAAYALVSYQTLWLKTHYPAAFMAAVLSADMDNTDKVVTLIEECRLMKLEVRPPAVNRSEYQFTIDGPDTVVYGLGAIKGVGEGAIEAMLQARRTGGPFRDIWEFCRRIDLHKANRRVLEGMIRAGALDGLAPNRATLMAQLPLALKFAEQHRATQAAGQFDLFGDLLDTGEQAHAAPDPQIASETREDWDDEQRLAGERETLGLYLTGHPIDRYTGEIDAMVGASNRIARLKETERDPADAEQRWDSKRRERDRRTIAGLVVSVRHGKTPRGRMGSVLLDDRTGRIEVTVFSELYETARALLVPDQFITVTGSLSFDDFRNDWTFRAEDVRTFEQARESQADHLALTLGAPGAGPACDPALVDQLRAIMEPFRGGDLRILMDYQRPGVRARLLCGDAWRVQPRDALLKQLRRLLGNEAVTVCYQRGTLPAMPAEAEKPKAARLTVVR